MRHQKLSRWSLIAGPALGVGAAGPTALAAAQSSPSKAAAIPSVLAGGEQYEIALPRFPPVAFAIELPVSSIRRRGLYTACRRPGPSEPTGVE